MADPRSGTELPALVDEDALATARTLYYTVQFEEDPATPASVDWAVEEVVEDDPAARAEVLDDLRRALASDEDLAVLLGSEAHADPQIRAFLRGVVARLEPRR